MIFFSEIFVRPFPFATLIVIIIIVVVIIIIVVIVVVIVVVASVSIMKAVRLKTYPPMAGSCADVVSLNKRLIARSVFEDH